ncbi:MAG TPA: response regulator transcription factor [Solirubrobacteraceae bacterium]|nr:response regulator transcription factor [Solirubrobacteraceae bacterium]
MATHLHLAYPAEDRSHKATPITVVLAENHGVVRRSLRRLLDAAERVDVIAEVLDLTAAAQQVHTHRPRVLVLDLGLTNGSSLETISRLSAALPLTRVVALTMEESPLFAQQAFDAGAVGLVLKDRADCELLEAVHRAARGEEYVSPRIATGLQMLRQAVEGDDLSPREVEVLRLIALGHTSVEIAAKLELSRRTVENHRARILRKLGCRTRADLVQLALRRHLIGS